MANIIIKGKSRFGNTRSEQEENLRREGMRSLSDEQLDRLKYIERKFKEKTGAPQSYAGQENIPGPNVAPDADK
ncbi:MAG: hypothetical protein WC648_05265 [Candidatus Paceibacterota bacterium]